MKRKVSLFLSLLLAFVMVFAAVGCKGDPNNSGNTDVRLKAIGVTKKPTKLEYVSGEKFDPTGMVVSAQYTDSKVKVITGWDYDKKAALQEEDDLITIKYTENDVTKTCTLKITVNPGIDHVKYHEFSNGKCSCGAMMFEAEKAITSGTPTSGNETFIIDSDKASGGKCIGNWGEGDNRWTTYFTVDKEVENVVIGMKFAPTGAINQGDWQYSLPTTPEDADRSKKTGPWPFEVRLNGTIVSWQTSEVPVFGGQDYFEWTTLLTNGLTFKKGENMIEIEPWDFYGANIDYIFVNVKTDVKGEYTLKEVVPEHKHEFTEKRCECGAAMGEAEDCEVTGTTASWDTSGKGFYRDEAGASGGYKVGAWGGNADCKIYVRITSDAEYQNVKTGFVIQTGGVANSEGFKFYKYDEETKTKGDAINHGSVAEAWNTWRTIKTDEMTIAKGESTYVIEAVGNTEIDFDYFFIEGITAESNVTFKKYVAPEPEPGEHLTHEFSNGKCVCGAVKIEAEDCEAGGTPSYSDTGFYRNDTGASGGKKIGGWGDNGDNRVYIKFTSDKEYKGANMIFRISTGSVPSGTGFDFYFEETKANKISHPNLAGSAAWYDVKSSAFDIKAGENVLVLEAYQANQIDWDYFVIEGVPADSVITAIKYVKPAPDPEEHLTHTFVNGKCVCGAVKIEAEDCEVIGTPADWAGPEGFYRASESLSGGKKVGAWGVNGDNRIYIKFTSDKAYENVTMTFRLSTGGVVNATAFDFYFNETRGTKIAHPDLSGGMGWTDIKSSAFNIKQGENFLVLEAYQSCEVDWDYFVIEGLAADSVITVTKYVPAA